MEFLEDSKIYSVNLFYQLKDGRVLGVSRRTDHIDWGLPGGKVDEDETPIEALVREVKEETGLTIDETKCTIVYERPGDND